MIPTWAGASGSVVVHSSKEREVDQVCVGAMSGVALKLLSSDKDRWSWGPQGRREGT